MGNGLVTEVNKNVWKNRRALLNHAFHKEYIDPFCKSLI